MKTMILYNDFSDLLSSNITSLVTTLNMCGYMYMEIKKLEEVDGTITPAILNVIYEQTIEAYTYLESMSTPNYSMLCGDEMFTKDEHKKMTKAFYRLFEEHTENYFDFVNCISVKVLSDTLYDLCKDTRVREVIREVSYADLNFSIMNAYKYVKGIHIKNLT